MGSPRRGGLANWVWTLGNFPMILLNSDSFCFREGQHRPIYILVLWAEEAKIVQSVDRSGWHRGGEHGNHGSGVQEMSGFIISFLSDLGGFIYVHVTCTSKWNAKGFPVHMCRLTANACSYEKEDRWRSWVDANGMWSIANNTAAYA